MWSVPWENEKDKQKAEVYVIKTMVGAGILAVVGRTKAKEACDRALDRVRKGEKASEVVASEVENLFAKYPPKEKLRKYDSLTAFVENEVVR